MDECRNFIGNLKTGRIVVLGLLASILVYNNSVYVRLSVSRGIDLTELKNILEREMIVVFLPKKKSIENIKDKKGRCST